MRPSPLSAGSAAQLAGLMANLKARLNQCADESGLSRIQIVDRLNDLATSAGVKLTGGNSKALSLATFEKWLNPSDRDHIPGVIAINAICAALGDHRPLAELIELHGLEVMDEQDRVARDYGKACLKAREAAREMKKLEANL